MFIYVSMYVLLNLCVCVCVCVMFCPSYSRYQGKRVELLLEGDRLCCGQGGRVASISLPSPPLPIQFSVKVKD